MSTVFAKYETAAAIVSDRATLDPGSTKPERLRALLAEAWPIALTGEWQLAAEALRLLMRLDRDLREARAQWNQDWFRRVIHARLKAVSRLHRRWVRINPPSVILLGSLRRRYHSNIARYLYEP